MLWPVCRQQLKAFKKRPEPDDDELGRRAEIVREKFGLPAKKWVKDIRKALA